MVVIIARKRTYLNKLDNNNLFPNNSLLYETCQFTGKIKLLWRVQSSLWLMFYRLHCSQNYGKQLSSHTNINNISKTHIVNATFGALYRYCVATCNRWSRINSRKVESFFGPQPYIPLEHLRHYWWRRTKSPVSYVFSVTYLEGAEKQGKKRKDENESRQCSSILKLSHLWMDSQGVTIQSVSLLLRYGLSRSILLCLYGPLVVP